MALIIESRHLRSYPCPDFHIKVFLLLLVNFTRYQACCYSQSWIHFTNTYLFQTRKIVMELIWINTKQYMFRWLNQISAEQMICTAKVAAAHSRKLTVRSLFTLRWSLHHAINSSYSDDPPNRKSFDKNKMTRLLIHFS